MQISLYEVLSKTQAEIFYRKHHLNQDNRQIAEVMNMTQSQIRAQFAKIKKKIRKLNESNVNVVTEIEETYEDMINRSGKRTVREVQVLSSLKSMSVSGTQPPVSNYMKKKLNLSQKHQKSQWKIVRQGVNSPPKRKIPESIREKNREHLSQISSTYRQYMEGCISGNRSLDEMADMELVLRSYGYIVKTPYLNKRNRRTSKILQASPYKIVVEMTSEQAKEYFSQGYTSAEVIETRKEITDDGNTTVTKLVAIDRSEAWNRNILGMQSLSSLAAFYHNHKFDPDADIDEMARIETVLQAYGFINQTPFIEQKRLPLVEQRKMEIEERKKEWFKF